MRPLFIIIIININYSKLVLNINECEIAQIMIYFLPS